MSGQPYKALVVDSDSSSRRETTHALALAGFEPKAAGDGREALKILDNAQYDLVVTDLKMPQMNGHALALQVLSRPESPKVVVLTHMTEPRLVRDLLARGVDDFVYKSTPGPLLGTKLLSLFDRDRWREAQAAADPVSQEASRENLMAEIEKAIAIVSDHYAERLKPAFEGSNAIPEPPRAMADFVKQLAQDEGSESEAEMSSQANVRGATRISVETNVYAVEMNSDLKPRGPAFQLALRDISKTGARLLNTRTATTTHLGLSWKAATLRYCTFYVPLALTRSQPKGRFYDVGGKFGV